MRVKVISKSGNDVLSTAIMYMPDKYSAAIEYYAKVRTENGIKIIEIESHNSNFIELLVGKANVYGTTDSTSNTNNIKVMSNMFSKKGKCVEVAYNSADEIHEISNSKIIIAETSQYYRNHGIKTLWRKIRQKTTYFHQSCVVTKYVYIDNYVLRNDVCYASSLLYHLFENVIYKCTTIEKYFYKNGLLRNIESSDSSIRKEWYTSIGKVAPYLRCDTHFAVKF